MKVPFKLRTGEEVNSEQLLGIKEDDLKKQLAAGGEAKTAVEALDTKFTTGLDEVKQMLNGIVANNNRGNGNNGNGNGNNGNGGDGGDNGGEGNQVDQSTLIALNATKVGLETKTELIKMQTRDALKADGTYEHPFWDQLKDDMEKLTKNDTLVRKADPNYWKNVYKICFADRFEELTKGKGRTRFNSEPTGAPIINNVTNNNSTEPTDIDKKMAANFNIPIEKYMASKSGLRFVS